MQKKLSSRSRVPTSSPLSLSLWTLSISSDILWDSQSSRRTFLQSYGLLLLLLLFILCLHRGFARGGSPSRMVLKVEQQRTAGLSDLLCCSVALTRSCEKYRPYRAVHIVSQVHSVIIVTVAFYAVLTETPDLELDKAFGWNDTIGFVHGIAVGYFIWDSLDAIINYVNLGFVAHGIACTLVYGLSYVSTFILCFILSWREY